jgi:hypothetical protein
LRDIQSPTGLHPAVTTADGWLHYRIHETPEDLALLTPRVAQPDHRASRSSSSASGTGASTSSTGESISKWAHYARLERRILGADFVQGPQREAVVRREWHADDEAD